MPSTFNITYKCGVHYVLNVSTGEILFVCADNLDAYIYMTGLLEARLEQAKAIANTPRMIA